jgi:hypothetical protein
MKALFLFLLFALSSCGTSQGVYRSYVISQSDSMEESGQVVEDYSPIVE